MKWHQIPLTHPLFVIWWFFIVIYVTFQNLVLIIWASSLAAKGHIAGVRKNKKWPWKILHLSNFSLQKNFPAHFEFFFSVFHLQVLQHNCLSLSLQGSLHPSELCCWTKLQSYTVILMSLWFIWQYPSLIKKEPPYPHLHVCKFIYEAKLVLPTFFYCCFGDLELPPSRPIVLSQKALLELHYYFYKITFP